MVIKAISDITTEAERSDITTEAEGSDITTEAEGSNIMTEASVTSQSKRKAINPSNPLLLLYLHEIRC